MYMLLVVSPPFAEPHATVLLARISSEGTPSQFGLPKSCTATARTSSRFSKAVASVEWADVVVRWAAMRRKKKVIRMDGIMVDGGGNGGLTASMASKGETLVNRSMFKRLSRSNSRNTVQRKRKCFFANYTTAALMIKGSKLFEMKYGGTIHRNNRHKVDDKYTGTTSQGECKLL